MKIDLLILKNLICNETFVRRVLPFLNSAYWQNKSEKLIFEKVVEYIQKYNTLPTAAALKAHFEAIENVTEDDFKATMEVLNTITEDSNAEPNNQWLSDETEKFCQERALYNAIMESIHIMDGKSKDKGKGMIPKLLSDALAVTFDTNIGHDYLESAEARWDYYHRVEERIPFDLEMLNKITKGGLPKKTLNVILAGVNVGKSLALCHFATAALAQNKNVLYITLEMAQEEIAKRIDANLLDIDIDIVEKMSKETYLDKAEKARSHYTKGKLIIKEFPTATAGAHHFKALITELKLKKQFVPDLIIIDYINCCCSSRIKAGGNINSYTYIKAISEELRGMAVEHDVPILTATQLTRSGFSSSDPDMTDTAESFGLPAVADWMVVMITSEELAAMNQILFKQIKSRYYNVTQNRKFVIGVDRNKMRLFDVDDKYQKNIVPEENDTGRTPRQEDLDEVMDQIRKTYKPKQDIQV